MLVKSGKFERVKKGIMQNYTNKELLLIWQKGRVVVGRDAMKVKKDDYGDLMLFEHYGDRESLYGWEVDHIIAKANGGTDNFNNLRPLNWKNNSEKSDKPVGIMDILTRKK